MIKWFKIFFLKNEIFDPRQNFAFIVVRTIPIFRNYKPEIWEQAVRIVEISRLQTQARVSGVALLELGLFSCLIFFSERSKGIEKCSQLKDKRLLQHLHDRWRAVWWVRYLFILVLIKPHQICCCQKFQSLSGCCS